MKPIVTAAALWVLLNGALPAWADLLPPFFGSRAPARPRRTDLEAPKRPPSFKVTLERDGTSQKVRIFLPQGMLETASIGQPDEYDDHSAEARTWVAGAALSLAIAAAGLWLLRYRRQPRRALRFTAVLGVSLTLIGCELLSMFRGEVEAAPERELLAQGTASVEKSDNDAVRIIFPAALANRIDPVEEKSK